MTGFENWASSPRDITWDDTLAFEAPILAEACETWRAVANGAIPPRSHITARLVKPFVGSLIIFERQDGGDFRIRLMGTRVTSVIGEMQGKTFDQTLPAEAADRWRSALNGVLTSRKPIRVVTLVNFNNLQFLEAEMLLAPLSNEEGQETMVFTVIVFRSGVTKARSKMDDSVTA